MSKFTDYIDGFADKTSTLAKEELKELIISAKNDKSEFVRMQAENVERWTVMLAADELTPAGLKKLVSKMDVLTKLETIKLEVAAKTSAQRLADGIQKYVINGLCKLITQNRRQIFLSYAAADHDIARAIATELRRNGLRVWFAEYELKVGDSLANKITGAISSSDYLVVLLSPQSVKSRWVQRELNAAFARDLSSRDITLIPVLISDCDVPSFLEHRVLIDLRANFQAGISKLVQKIGIAPNIDFSLLTPKQFERLVADLFSSSGFSDLQFESPVGDRRVDIVAKYTATDPLGGTREEIWLVEVKFYRKERADIQALQQLMAYLVKLPEKYRGVLVTNSQLTSVANTWLETARITTRQDIRIIDGTELRRLLLKHSDVAAKYFTRGVSK